MKEIFKYSILAILVAATLMTACKKEEDDVRLDTKLSTIQVLNVTSDSATIVGFVIAAGDGITEKGVCYNTLESPTIENLTAKYDTVSKNAQFSVQLAGLDYATKYYVRAYAKTADEVVYGDQLDFTTKPVIATLTTTAVTSVTGNSALSGGNITIDGGAEIEKRGLVYSTATGPDVNDENDVVVEDTTQATGEYVITLTELKGNTTYFIRAFAENSAGVGYGQEIEFTTLVDLPKVTTAVVTEITKVSAVSGGEVTDDGGAAISDKGVVWGLAADPTTADNIVSGGSGDGSFVSNITGLEKLTTYHVRAYATNSAGTSYGEDIEFTTEGDIRKWYVPGDYVAASYPGSELLDWSPEFSPYILNLVTDPDNLEGYVYMANASNNWKFATQPNWDGPNYGAGASDTLLDAAGDNINLPAGFYKLTANAADLTYKATAMIWGVIGDATPNAWDDETPLTYHPESQKWRGVVHLTAAEFKFRANHSWDYNYGSTSADENLDAGGLNIAIDTESDYAIELDLSTPHNYTYVANRWGLIGNATPEGWDNDTNMTWDEGNGVFTLTVDLTVGEMKFRANDDWGTNFGGDIANLTQDGNNIAVTEAGNYTITLDVWNAVATITKN